MRTCCQKNSRRLLFVVYCSPTVIVDMCRSADQVRGRGCKSDKVRTRFPMLRLSCWEEKDRGGVGVSGRWVDKEHESEEGKE